MTWDVLKVLCRSDNGHYIIVAQCDNIKIIAEVYCFYKVKRGDILLPFENSRYLINNNSENVLEIISASEFSKHSLLTYKKPPTR